MLGSDNKENLILLTAREHFICHWLLTKMTTATARTKMIYAFNAMRRANTKQQRYFTKITSRAFANISGKSIVTAATKQKMSISAKLRPAVSTATRAKLSVAGIGRKTSDITKEKLSGRSHSIETKEKLSKLHKGKPKTEEHKQNMRKPKSVQAKLNMSHAQTGRIISEEHKQKLSIAAKARWANR